jgi:small subunit ribosomal protein S16
MVRLRLRRMGSNDKPFYRIVAVDSRVKRDGKYIECIGWYDPKPNPLKYEVDNDLALKWLKVGAQPSDTVRSLFRRAGVLKTWHEHKVAQKKGAEPETKE